MTRDLQRKAGQVAKMLSAARESEVRRQEAVAALTGVTPKIREHAARLQRLKAGAEAAISSMFSGRRVNILGEINNVLASASAG